MPCAAPYRLLSIVYTTTFPSLESPQDLAGIGAGAQGAGAGYFRIRSMTTRVRHTNVS